MSGITRADDLLVETIDKVLSEHSTPERIGAAEGHMDDALWNVLDESGLTLVGAAEANGGSGGTLHDFAAIVKASGAHAAAVPLADTLIAANTLAGLGQTDVPAGPLSYAVIRSGMASVRVMWAGVAEHVVFVTVDDHAEGGIASTRVAVVAKADLTIMNSGINYAGEPWCDVDTASLPAGSDAVVAVSYLDALASGALTRSLQMAGACQRVVELCVQYVMEREQFGKPIGKFQIIQHYLSEMAGEAAAAEAAADNAIDVIAGGGTRLECTQACAAAKAYAGRAVAIINRLAHQIHGAIGYTDEHRLQYWTRRLWSWRDEFGTESQWAAELGKTLVAAGGPALWPRLTNWPPAVA
jgi:acyl-CoA dehydrogenase